MLNTIFPYLNPTPECDSAFRSVVCDYVFESCNGNSTSSSFITRDQCRDVRDRLCMREWTEIEHLLGLRGLPVCEDLPTKQESLTSALDSEVNVSSSSCNGSSFEAVDTHSPSNPLNCSEFFFFDASSNLCLPICGWSPHLDQNANNLARDISAICLLVFSIINLLSAFTIQRHTL